MIRGVSIALILAGFLALAPRVVGQSPAGGDSTPPTDNQPSADAKKPASTPPPSSANPFPEDTTTVPVLPSQPAALAPPSNVEQRDDDSLVGLVPLPRADIDPVRSPDDPAPNPTGAQGEGWSSSLKDVQSILDQPSPDDQRPGKKKKREPADAEKQPTRKEAATHDIGVGSYYLDTRDWKGALSRFESALILDPENPEVYWGLAEAERHLGQFANARAHFEKLLLYDPDGKHAREARKALKDPAIANAQEAGVAQPPSLPQP